MATHDLIKLFDGTKIRVVWDDKQEKYYFSVVDVVSVLTDSANPTDYLKKMRKRDPELAEGWGQIVTPLTYQTMGGPQKLNFADMQSILRIIQSIPSKKAELIKRPLCLSRNLELQSSSRAAAWSLGHQ